MKNPQKSISGDTFSLPIHKALEWPKSTVYSNDVDIFQTTQNNDALL
jgi:hypothetical protein